ncbi:hypothetical protein D0T49_09700 [Paludibacter sp. 221]|uniref:DUF6089 family protein n=1 Tax=Paludibacter sp. 221 TaxID=2302939 RepID=UPI0013D47C4F|nr:DUF6089 family protein [Paludibacter sp. 221]NDV47318.1 hypothetical protein [Paludibacter sp. 221]
MKRFFIFIVFIFVLLSGVRAQNNGLIGRDSKSAGFLSVGAGSLAVLGDLGSIIRDPLFDLENRHMFSVVFRHLFFDDRFGYRVAVFYGEYNGSDKNFKSPERGYAFEATMVQSSFQAEYSLINNNLRNSSITYEAFLRGGLALAFPEVVLTGEAIRPVDSSELNKPAFGVPFGIGFDFGFASVVKLGVDIGVSYYFNDYLDGISTSYSKSNDLTGEILLTLSFRLFGKKVQRGCRCDWK